MTETKCYGVLAKALLWLNCSCHPAQFYITLLFQWNSLRPPQLFSQFLNYPFNGRHLSKKGGEINTLSAVGFFKGKHSSTPELFEIMSLLFGFVFGFCFFLFFFGGGGWTVLLKHQTWGHFCFRKKKGGSTLSPGNLRQLLIQDKSNKTFGWKCIYNEGRGVCVTAI